MFVNRINSVTNPGFKGYQHVKNDVGETVTKFNYVYDYDKETCEVQIFKAVPTQKYNYMITETPIATIKLDPNGTTANIQELTNLDKNDAYAYKIVRRDKNTGEVIWEGADTGVKLKPENGEYVFRVSNNKNSIREEKDKQGNIIGHVQDFDDSVNNYKYTLVTRKGTTPLVQGTGYLLSPDSFVAGAKYSPFSSNNTGNIIFDKEAQIKAEQTQKNFSNVLGGNLAGMQLKLPYLKENGYTSIFGNPIANGSRAWSLGYWNINNNQMSPNIGNMENFASFFRDLYKNGMKFVYDGTYTSEGIEGIHVQYALRWANQNPQTKYWFKTQDLKTTNIGLGVIPTNAKNLRHRVINSPYNYELQENGTYKKVVNPDYNSNKETLFQIYDAAQATEEQVKSLDKAIVNYENVKNIKELDINSHDDTIINYVFQINPEEYDNRINLINSLNKNDGKNIKLDSTDGTVIAGHFTNFKIDRKTEGGFVAWDANTDMWKMNYHISGYDEKPLQAITSRSQRDYERQMIERGAREVQDMAIQSGKYWTGKVKDIQTLYTAKTIGKAKSLDDINKLIKEGKLPELQENVKMNNNTVTNILNGQYLLQPKGILTKDDITVKALMRAPLDSIEFGENTTGVISSSYFSNRATTDETIGISRFDLMKQNNPHLVEPYANNYKKVNNLYRNEIKNFADSVIRKVNENSNEKLLDSYGEYTEYGEYIIELIGQDIAKYAFIKSLVGDNIKTKTLENGEITYDYDDLKERTTLKALDINAVSPTDEASQLERKIEKGLKKLSDSDIKYVADSISKRISGTDTASFRLAEAFVDRAGYGLDMRLDACKDVMDMDAVRNQDNAFEDIWNDNIKFWSKFINAYKSENPHGNVVGEITDIPDLMKDTHGLKADPYDGVTNIGQMFNGEPDAFAKFFNETGITTEAGYSYAFTDLLAIFAPSFDGDNRISDNHDSFKNRFDLLLETRNIDYLRNLYTFMGNHDKPRMIHGLALDMNIFHSNILNGYNKEFEMGRNTREAAIKVLSGAKTNADIPIELRLNVDNNNYFLTTSTKAIAMSKLLMDIVNQDLNGIASEDDKKRIIDAIVDLTNGNYLGVGNTENMQKIKIKELSSIENALDEILNLSGVTLSETERKNIIKKANEMDLTKYLVHGDFDWKELDAKEKDNNSAAAKEILGETSSLSRYSLYTVQLARLIKDSYNESGLKKDISSGLKKFVEKYDKAAVNAGTSEFKRIEDPITAMRKNGYAARDIRLAISMAVKQAEFKNSKAIENKQAIIDKVYQLATEPAVAKAAMIMEFLKGLPGMPTMYAGDEMGLTGYDEKAKNIYLQNRNALPWTEVEGESNIAKYRRYIMNTMNSTLKDRRNKELDALNNGTPYALDIKANGKTRAEAQLRIWEINDTINKLQKQLNDESNNKTIKTEIEKLENERRSLTKDMAKIAYLMQGANGNMTVTLFNAGDVEFSNRFNYFEKYGLDTEDKRKKFFAEHNIESVDEKNPYIPILPKSEMDAIVLGAGIAIPVGTVFTNANSKDKVEYVVKDLGGKLGIVRKDGKKIIMDGLTSKNGVMILKHIKNVIFKGGQKKPAFYNAQYNFVSNPYKFNEPAKEGKNLSIISKV